MDYKAPNNYHPILYRKEYADLYTKAPCWTKMQETVVCSLVFRPAVAASPWENVRNALIRPHPNPQNQNCWGEGRQKYVFGQLFR